MLSKGDFSYFCAIAAPEAEYNKYRLYSDWVHWIFPFDDLFDSGSFRDDPVAAKAVLDNLVACLHEKAFPEAKWVGAHQDIWNRLQEDAPPGVCERFIDVITDYCSAVLHQVEDAAQGRIRNPDEMIEMRRDTIGVRVLHVFVEYTYRLNLPRYVFRHPLIKEVQTLGIDWILFQNDVVSYCTEEDEGVEHNLISSTRAQGKTAQEAFAHLGSMLEGVYQRFDRLMCELPSWEDAVDAEVKVYLQGLKNCVKANLEWSFRTD